MPLKLLGMIWAKMPNSGSLLKESFSLLIFTKGTLNIIEQDLAHINEKQIINIFSQNKKNYTANL